jgi:hypothetical protein
MPAAQVALAGSIELICAIGLTLGLFTRPVALLGSVYLLMSMLLGGHFQIGYVWALPEGGYEFVVFWAVMIAVFVVLGGHAFFTSRRVQFATLAARHTRSNRGIGRENRRYTAGRKHCRAVRNRPWGRRSRRSDWSTVQDVRVQSRR